jgi:hypothetical protein
MEKEMILKRANVMVFANAETKTFDMGMLQGDADDDWTIEIDTLELKALVGFINDYLEKVEP